MKPTRDDDSTIAITQMNAHRKKSTHSYLFIYFNNIDKYNYYLKLLTTYNL